MYGFQDSSEVASGSNGGKFGLNTGVKITKFCFNPNAGKDNTPAEAMDFTVQIGEREYYQRFFPVNKVFGKDGEITDTNSDEYKAAIKKEVSLLNGALTDIARCFASEEDIKNALLGVNDFKSFAEALERVSKLGGPIAEVDVDVFLCYQWQPKGEQTKTYLELPKNVKHGSYVCQTKGAGYKKETSSTGVKYVNEEGLVHPLKRNEWFANSAFANQTDLGGGEETMDNAAAGNNSNADW